MKLLFILTYLSSSFAAFFPASILPERFGLNAKIENAVVSVMAADKEGSSMYCTGTFVSDQGHLLIASHCLEAAAFNPAHPNHLELELNGKKVSWKILFLSPCREEMIKKGEGLGDVSRCEYYDLALLEPLSSPFFAGKENCLSFDNEPAEDIIALGYPSRTMRLKGGNSDGSSFFVSYGKKVNSPSCTITNSQMRFRLGEQIDLRDSLAQAQREHALQMDVDVVSGNSGGPIINAHNGNVVGVVSFASREGGLDPKREECSGGAAYFSPTKNLESALRVWNQRRSTQRITTTILPPLLCKQRKVN